jgi:predicted DNA-binding transcriptional regulator YafY
MTTSTRLLKLLSLLQGRRDWTGPQLADELGVTTRTVRNDVERVRELGYPVQASPGVAGGYRLGAGTALPPLLLDHQEAIAVAVGLRVAAAGAVAGVESVALAALAKLEQVMPSRVRRRVRTLQQAVVMAPSLAPPSDADTLSAIAAACADRERLRFGYRSHDGATTRRDTEPHRLVHEGRRWYLVAWDVDRSAWRTFRVDRIAAHPSAGPRFVPRDPPASDLLRHLLRGVQQATWQARARVKVHAPAAEVSKRVPAAVTVEAVGDRACIASVGADSFDRLAPYLGMLGADFEVVEPPELREAVRALGQRFLRAAAPVPRKTSRKSP